MLKTSPKIYLVLAVVIAVMVNEFYMVEANPTSANVFSRLRLQKSKFRNGGIKRSQEPMGLDDTNLCILACAECAPEELATSDEDGGVRANTHFFYLESNFLE